MGRPAVIILALSLIGALHFASCHKKNGSAPQTDEYQALFDSIQQKVQFPTKKSHSESGSVSITSGSGSQSGSRSAQSGGDDSDDDDDSDFGGSEMFRIFTEMGGSLVPTTCQSDADCSDSGLVCSRFLGKCVAPAANQQGRAQVCSNDTDCCPGEICDNYNGLLTINRCRQGNSSSASVSVSLGDAKASLKPTKNNVPSAAVNKAGSAPSNAGSASSSSGAAKPIQLDASLVGVSSKKSKKTSVVAGGYPAVPLQAAIQQPDNAAADVAAGSASISRQSATTEQSANVTDNAAGVSQAGQSEAPQLSQPVPVPSQPQPPQVLAKQRFQSKKRPSASSNQGVTQSASGQSDNTAAAGESGLASNTLHNVQQQLQLQSQLGGQSANASGSDANVEVEGSGDSSAGQDQSQQLNQNMQTPPNQPGGDADNSANNVQMQSAAAAGRGRGVQVSSGANAVSGSDNSLKTKSKSIPLLDTPSQDSSQNNSTSSDDQQSTTTSQPDDADELQLSLMQNQNAGAPPKVLISTKTGLLKKSKNKSDAAAANADNSAGSNGAASNAVPPVVPRY